MVLPMTFPHAAGESPLASPAATEDIHAAAAAATATPPPPPLPPAEPLASQEWIPKAPLQVAPLAVGKDGRTIAERVALLKECAQERFAAGDPKMAISMYTDAIRLSGPSHTLLSNRSACYCAARKYVEAFEDACKCIDLMPTFTKGYVRKGAALHGMDRWSEAIKAYEAGLKVEPSSRACLDGIDDARKRLALAGGEWRIIGNRRVADEWGNPEWFFRQPYALCAGPSGGFCVIDRGRNVVRVLNADATYIRCTLNDENKVNMAGLFGEPSGVACDGAHVYVTDQMRCRVVKCDATNGKLVSSVGRSGSGTGNFDMPWGLALADTSALHEGVADTTLFVSDAKNHRVVALSAADLSWRYAFGRWGTSAGEMIEPHGLATSPDGGNLLAVADSGNKRVVLWTLEGTCLRCVGPTGLDTPFVGPTAHVALSEAHLFVLEEPQPLADHDKPSNGLASRIHALDPQTGAVLRPPLVPPFAADDKLRGLLQGLAVFHGSLYASSAYGCVLALVRRSREVGQEMG